MKAKLPLLIFGIVPALAVGREYPSEVELPSLPNAIANYCFECHDSVSAEAEIDLESLEAGSVDPFHAAHLLEELRLVIESHDMPPAKSEQPTESERAGMLAWVEGQLDRLAELYEDDPGIVAMPRLTNYEYRNVIRDLTGGVVTHAGNYLPNEGGAGEGFANVGLAQGMVSTHIEKYLEAAKGALRHLTVTPHDGFVWSEVAYPESDAPAVLRQQLIDEIISWHVGQQQKWNAEHQQHLSDALGRSHAVYLEAAWRFRYRKELDRADDPIAAFAECEGERLAPVALAKWWRILNDPDSGKPFSDWATAWRELPGPDKLTSEGLRNECIAITSGERGGSLKVNEENYAPPYEISFHEAKEEVLESATKDGIWPFRIEIGDAKELFLVMTDAGDGNRGEYGIWRRGRILFEDGTSRNWEEILTIVGANSGREFPYGIDGRGSGTLPPNAIGVQPPGALKFAVPEGATVFEIDLTLDENLTDRASIQALVLKEKPRSQSYIPNRYVFGGKARAVDATNEANKERTRLLRRRNVSEANRTKIGLNAERNVLARWDRTPIKFLGGPWPDQEEDRENPDAPYHYTTEQVLRNATAPDLAELETLLNRLESVVEQPSQEIYAFARGQGLEEAKEGVLPPESVSSAWTVKTQENFVKLAEALSNQEEKLTAKALPWILNFAEQAWCRSLNAEELALFEKLYRESRARGASFDAAVKSALMLVLNSPDFLYRLGPGQSQTASENSLTPLSDHQLANRLAFFLWASIPDSELIEKAESGQLSSPEVLSSQVGRMLRDERARSLATDFAGQLWGFAGFESFENPDEETFPDFTPTLRESMLDEVLHFLDDLFRNDRSLTALLDSRHTFADGRLARHYGIDGISGNEMREVEVDPTQRGGLLGMGLFLTKTSLPLRTSPVQRGTWVLEQVLGRELPSPPADVPDLSEGSSDEAGMTILEQLAVHREDEGCASCHDKIDPLGVALENFDPIGRWRETGFNRATSHDGYDLEGLPALKAYLLSRQDDFFAHFHRKLLGYALGRSVGPGDRKLLRKLDATLRENEYRLSPVIEAIVLSPQFRLSRLPSES